MNEEGLPCIYSYFLFLFRGFKKKKEKLNSNTVQYETLSLASISFSLTHSYLGLCGGVLADELVEVGQQPILLEPCLSPSVLEAVCIVSL